MAERVTILCYYREINDSSDKELARDCATVIGAKTKEDRERERIIDSLIVTYNCYMS